MSIWPVFSLIFTDQYIIIPGIDIPLGNEVQIRRSFSCSDHTLRFQGEDQGERDVPFGRTHIQYCVLSLSRRGRGGFYLPVVLKYSLKKKAQDQRILCLQKF